MSIRELADFPALDMFSGKATTPYRGFGDVIQDAGELELKLHADATQVRMDVKKAFRVMQSVKRRQSQSEREKWMRSNRWAVR